MFDIEPKDQKTKFEFMQDLYNPDTSSTEDILPISYIKNGIVYLKDDSKIVYLTFPGKNISLLSEKDKENYAQETAKIFSGLTVETSAIFYIPEKTDSNANLNKCRRRVQELENKLYSFTGSDELKRSYEKQLVVLKNYILADIEKETVSSPTIQGKTYIGLKFTYSKEREIFNVLFNVKKRILEATGKEAIWLENVEDILDFIDNWFNCQVSKIRDYTPKIVMPSF